MKLLNKKSESNLLHANRLVNRIRAVNYVAYYKINRESIAESVNTDLSKEDFFNEQKNKPLRVKPEIEKRPDLEDLPSYQEDSQLSEAFSLFVEAFFALVGGIFSRMLFLIGIKR